MAKNYTNELEGMFDFYKTIGLENEIDYIVNSDGIYDDCVLFEHKLFIGDSIGKALFQSIKYTSKLRLLGKLIPEKLIINDLNREIVYIFDSNDYLEHIEKVYIGAASKSNDGFDYLDNYETINYDSFDGRIKLMNLIKKAKEDKNYTKYHVDFTNILQLSKEFYKHINSKDAFINGPDCEIRKPNILKDRIYPYTKESNNEFINIMDCLNTKEQQKFNGAFYTPELYASLSQKMLLDRIEKIKEMGLDYIVIDRCAGTGALYRGLPDEVLSHCVLSTLEINEYLLLQEEFMNKSTIVVPPTDALSYDIIPTEIDGDGNIISDFIREKIQDPNCAIILYENPPFAEAGSQNKEGKKDVKMKWKDSFVYKEMNNELTGDVKKDLSNLFIWSAFKYYLRRPYDTYIVYSPVKYWKTQNLVNKKFINGFVCNRKEFHASESAILCAMWSCENSDVATIKTDVYSINNNDITNEGKISINKVYRSMSNEFDRRKFDDDTYDSIYSNPDGRELDKNTKIATKSIFNENIIGYMSPRGFFIKGSNIYLTRNTLYNGRGFYLRKDNYINKLPLFLASDFYNYMKWYEKDLICKCSDLTENIYIADKEFMKKSLIYTCLSSSNKCRSLIGSDGRLYKNELCFDKNTVATNDLKHFDLSEEEKDLLLQYESILELIKMCEEYKPEFTYGIYQIQEEINIDIDSGIKDKKGKEKSIKKYLKLNDKLNILKRKLKDYYINNIYQDLYKYELLK